MKKIGFHCIMMPVVTEKGKPIVADIPSENSSNDTTQEDSFFKGCIKCNIRKDRYSETQFLYI